MNQKEVIQLLMRYRISSPYGERIRNGVKEFHRGADFALPEGNPLYSITEGFVKRRDFDSKGGYFIVIGDKGTSYEWGFKETKFLHMKQQSALAIGEQVKVGQFIGYSGNTGSSTGAHLHLERWEDEEHVDPIVWMQSLIREEEKGMFKDVYSKAWYAKVVEKAVKYGLMAGKKLEDGQIVFDPSGYVTRAEMAAVTVRNYEATNEDFVEIINNVLPAVVQINLPTSLGSGTVIHPDGYILTNAHVVDSALTVIVYSPDQLFDGVNKATGKVIAVNKTADLAIVKIDVAEPLATLKLSANKTVQSTKVLAIGSPIGFMRSTTEGVVSGYRNFNDYEYLQTEAEINPGNSGGALVNLQGELIGVPTMKYDQYEGLSFAITSAEVREFIAKAVEAGDLPKELLNL